jgi:hypothetical protein
MQRPNNKTQLIIMADSSHDRLSGVKDQSWQKKWLAVPAPKFRLKLLRNGSLYSDTILINLFDLLSASAVAVLGNLFRWASQNFG